MTLKRDIAPKTGRSRTSSAAGQETKVARLARELNEAVEQQTATAEILRVISSSPGDLQPVFEAILENATRICEANFGVLVLYENAAFQVAATHNAPPAFVELRQRQPTIRASGALGRVVAAKQLVHISDCPGDISYKQGDADFVQFVDLCRVRSLIMAPMLKENELIGVIAIYRTEVRPFTDKQIALVQNFASQAVIAIENTRLLTDLSESLQQQTGTADVLQAISRSTFDLPTVLSTLVELAARLCRADMAQILLPSKDVHSFYSAASYGHTPEYNEYVRTLTFAPGREGVLGRVLLEHRPVQIADVLADPDYRLREVQRLGGFRTHLGLPLLREGKPIGILIVSRATVQPFDDKHIALLTTFADQAVVAIENTRLFEAEQQRTRELSESLAQQTATSEVLRVISSSPGDLGPVFQAMLENATRICEAKFGNLFLNDDGAFRAVAWHGEPTYVEVWSRQLSINISDDPRVPLARLAKTKRPVHVADLREEPAYKAGFAPLVTLIDSGRARTLLIVPMLKEHTLVGAIAIYRQEVRPFTDKQIELVTNFAAQAVIAIENTRLLNELRHRTDDLTESLEQQTATSKVLQVISRSPGDLQPVFQSMLENAVQICDAKFGNIYRWQDDALHLVAAHNTPPALIEARRRSPPADALVGRIVATKKLIHVADVAAEPGYLEQRVPSFVAAVELGGIRTLLLVPMLKENELIGAFSVYRQDVRPFTDKQIELVQNFAAQAVIAIENARLLNELRQRTAELTELLEQQTATSEVLRVISSSPADLQPVFEAMVDNAVRICDATGGSICRWDGDALHHVALKWAQPAFAELMMRTPIHPNPKTNIGRMLATKTVVHVPDLAAQPAYIEQREPGIVAAVEIGHTRTVLAVPMLRESELIGAVILGREEVRPFTDKQIALVKNFAAQAVIAIENTRLLNELRESLERQMATSEVLRVISSSPGDLQPVFEAMLANATRICEAKFGVLALSEGDAFRTVALHGAPPAYAEARRREPVIRPGLETGIGRAASTRQPVQIADIRAEPAYINDPQRFAILDLAGARTMLNVPMLKEDALVGVVAIYRQDVRSFTDKQIELVQNFAAQAVIAIENARLLNELRQRTDELGRSVGELRALGEVSQAVNSTLDLETVLSTIVTKAVQLSGTEAGAIYVFDDRQSEFHLRATYGMDQELIDALTRRRIGMDDPNVAHALAQREPVQIADLNEAAPSAVNDIILRAGYRALLVAALLRGEDIVGILVVRRRTPGQFAQNTVDLIKTFAAQSAVAIENARLFQNVETSLEDLRTAQDRLVQTEKLASLGQLTAGIAHEIKNPLNFVNNFSAVSVELIDELREALGGAHLDSKLRTEISEIADALQGNLDKVVQHGKRADAIVKNMLLHSREGSGEHRRVDVNALVEESLNLAYHGARAEKQGFKINMERSFDPAAGEVDVFPQEITRALLNLISNGFYAATKRKEQNDSEGYEPTLTASTKNLGDRVEIRICDNGTGVSPEVREKMFNPFFTTKPAGEGTGLGLSISHDIIVKQHCGSIEVETEPGAFTEFRIVLPRAGVSLIKSGERM